jgi:pyruvate-formate lyase-activating enzyme
MYLTLFNNQAGEVLEHQAMTMLGRSGSDWVQPEAPEMIPLPRGASLVTLPGYIPVGLINGELSYCATNPLDPSQKVSAVAALLPQGFTRTLLPACVNAGKQGLLPLFGYAAVGFKHEQIYVAAVQTDEHRKWHPVYYNTDGLPGRISRMLKKYPHNRIYRQLARCALEYSCFTAQNIFYQRWEGGIPSTCTCNANCLGCISESHLTVESPQHRLDFIPTAAEITEVGTEHLQKAREGIISFGQGCEGDPALNGDTLAQAIRQIRQQTEKGMININTNAGCFEGIKAMCDAGLNAMRVTIFSCVKDHYNKYHRPRNYSLADVIKSINYAGEKKLRVALNLLTFPGFTDREDELEHLIDFLRHNEVHAIQFRNLNIDPDYLFSQFGDGGPALGITSMMQILQQEVPQVELTSYTHPY